MFSSLTDLLNVPIVVKKRAGIDGAGDEIPGEELNIKCYPVMKTENIINMAGEEEVSSTQLYINGDVNIEATDTVHFNNKDYRIKALGGYYDDEGNLDIWVVYL